MGTLDSPPHAITEHQKEQRKLTIILIVIGIGTLLVGIATIYLSIQTGMLLSEIKKINEREFTIENFPLEVYATSTNIFVQQKAYDREPLTITLSVSALSPHHLKIIVEDVYLSPSNSATLDEEPELIFEKPVIKFFPKELSNIDIQLPVRLNLNPIPFTDIISAGHNDLGTVTIKIKVIDIQTNQELEVYSQSNLVMWEIIQVEVIK